MGKVKVKKYERAIIDLMQKYRFSAENDEAHIIADSLNHHYQVLRTGWTDENTYHLWVKIHFQIKPNDKIWILENRTEDDVAEALIKRGVDKADIVLGFLPAYARPYSDYAVA
ncbi:MAG: hypothetical protein RL329_1936 [Bacteroidota bacterium]|jgi:glycine cleavage system aminomethyltransferase T